MLPTISAPLLPPIITNNKDGAQLCLGWKRGVCDDNRCIFRHYYLERDQVPASRVPLQQVNGNTAFSSPLVVKKKTFTEKHRREEVDLETGKRRSWIEIENKELIDITGEASPPRNLAQSSCSAKLKEKVAQEEREKKRELEMREKRKKTEDSKAKGQCSICGRKFKGERGVNSHLSKSKCGKSSAAASVDMVGAAAASGSADLDGTVYVISDDEAD